MNFVCSTAFLLVSLIVQGVCKSENYTRNGYTLIFEDKTYGFSSDTHNRMVQTFFVVYPKQVNIYNRAAPKKVVFFVDPSYHGVAATSGNVVRFDASYFAKHPKDIDVVTHETMHIVQAYTGRVPVWAVEGIADYVRYTMGVDNKGAGWSLPAFKPSQRYTNGYAVTARFFVWLEKKVKRGLVKAYDKALRDGKHADFFKRFTGKTVDQLWQKYAKNPKI